MIRYDPLFFFDDTRLAAENNGRRNAVHKLKSGECEAHEVKLVRLAELVSGPRCLHVFCR